MKAIGILPERRLSYVDHLVPLCQLLNIPLLVTDPWVKMLIELYYPPMEIQLAQPIDFNLDPYLKEYDCFVYVDYFRKGNGSFQFGEFITTHKARSIMSLHGHPDKYWNIYWIEQLMGEDLILAYGSKLFELLAHRGVRKKPLICGNYRLEFYKAYENFFDQKLPFQKERETILYAPTWAAPGEITEHRSTYSNFFEVYQQVFDSLSQRYQLIVKVHPHMAYRMAARLERVIADHPHIYFLHDYPPIYPLLKQMDHYLGDYSSIGYDFLYFDRPFFLLEGEEKTHLHHCQDRKNLYLQVYGESKPLSQLKQEINNAYRSSSRRS